MLYLDRRPLESIVIGEGIRLTVVDVVKGQVVIGIEAPRSVRVMRSELVAGEPHPRQPVAYRPGMKAGRK